MEHLTAIEPQLPSSFDAHNPPEKDLLADCVHCGFCLPACPTYALWGEEMDSPRGRIYMMDSAAKGKAPLDQAFRVHMDNCLGCMACMTACPSGVQYGKLIEDTRGQVERNIPRPVGDSLFRRLLFATFPHPRRLKLLAWPLFFYQRSGLQRLVRRLGLTRLLPARLRAMEELLPTVPRGFGRALPQHILPSPLGLATSSESVILTLNAGKGKNPRISPGAPQPLAQTTSPFIPSSESVISTGGASAPERRNPHLEPATNPTPRRRVGMLTGCVQSVFFPHVNEATARVLAAEGCEIIVPPSQPCCGALMLHSGLDAEAASMAKAIITLFEQAEVDTVLINAAGCGSTMKDYGHLLRNDPDWAERARAFSARCRDVAELLAELPPLTPRHPLPLRIAYHDACHLRHAQGIFFEPRALLASIPGLEVAEIAESSMCCGSAGVYNLLHPEPANELGDRKTAHLLDTHASAVVSANPGCLLQLMAGLRRQGHAELPAFHLVELLDASIRGLTPESLLHQKPLIAHQN